MPTRKKGTKFKIEGAPGTSSTRGEAWNSQCFANRFGIFKKAVD